MKVIQGLKEKTKIVKNLLNKEAPHIFVGAGILSMGGAVVLGIIATRKLDSLEEEMDYIEEKLNRVHEEYKDKTNKPLSDEEYEAAIRSLPFQRVMKVGMLYAPTVIATVGGAGLIIWGERILTSRNAALAAAYAVVSASFSKYRENVREEYGEEVDFKMRHGVTRTEIQTNKKGVEIVKKVTEPEVNEELDYSRRFADGTTRMWQNTAQMNLFTLRAIQSQMNDELRQDGMLFLARVYDMLGFKRTKPSMAVGWVYNHPAAQDEFVDFGLSKYNLEDPRVLDKLQETGWILDFNVDGVILDLL